MKKKESLKATFNSVQIYEKYGKDIDRLVSILCQKWTSLKKEYLSGKIHFMGKNISTLEEFMPIEKIFLNAPADVISLNWIFSLGSDGWQEKTLKRATLAIEFLKQLENMGLAGISKSIPAYPKNIKK